MEVIPSTRNFVFLLLAQFCGRCEAEIVILCRFSKNFIYGYQREMQTFPEMQTFS